MTEDKVSDEEELYRNIRHKPEDDEYYYDENTRTYKIANNGFRDRKQEPSVDRAKLRNFNPILSIKEEGDGIVSLEAIQVRQIGYVESRNRGGKIVKNIVDVIPEPIPGNDAHAKITVNPKFSGTNSNTKKSFKNLRKALARIANVNGWTIKPKFQ